MSAGAGGRSPNGETIRMCEPYAAECLEWALHQFDTCRASHLVEDVRRVQANILERIRGLRAGAE